MIRFLVDSSSDCVRSQIEKQNNEYVSIGITVGNKTYQDGVDIDRNEFFEMISKTKDFPKTSQPSPQDYIQIFEKAKESGDELICIVLSSALSGTVQSATLAKNMVDYEGIYIIDSLTATYAIKVLLDYGMKLREEGKNAYEIAEKLNQLKSRTRVFATLDTLDNLYKGGRLSKFEASVGNIAKIKPLIELSKEGTVALRGKSVGKKKALNDMIKLIEEQHIDKEFPIISIYSYGLKNSDAFMERLADTGIKCTERLQIGPTIGTHIGAGAYGLIFVEEEGK